MSDEVHPLDVHSSPSRPAVRSASMRKLGKDGTSWTPTEARMREKLLSQYRKLEVPIINSAEYQAAYEGISWAESEPPCETCGHGQRCHPGGRCFMKGCQCWDRKRER